MDEIVCKQCGRCCYFFVKDKIVKCGNLVLLKDGKTRCRVYATRLGRPLSKDMRCAFRKDCPWNFKDCPYNVLFPDKPMFPVDVKVKGVLV